MHDKSFELNPLPEQLPEVLRDGLSQCDPASIGHLREEGFLPPDIRALNHGSKICGTAVTLAVEEGDGALLSHVIDRLRPHDVLVISCPEHDVHAYWGEVLSTAVQGQFAGVVIDGFATDKNELRNMQFPIWCRGFSANTSKFKARGGRLNIPVQIGRVCIRPGDAVLADVNGVFVSSPSDLESLIKACRDYQDTERKTLQRLAGGEKISEIYQTEAHFPTDGF